AERSAPPERAFVHVSRVLQRYPQFELDNLRWSIATPVEQREAGLKALAPDTQTEATVLVELSGRVNAAQRNDYRAITAHVQQFAAALVGEGCELVRTQLPFDVTFVGLLSVDTGAGADAGPAPRFAVVPAWRLPSPSGSS